MGKESGIGIRVLRRSKMQFLPIHTREGTVRRQEGFLAEVLCQLDILCQAIEHTPDARLIEHHKSLEGRCRSLASFECELGFVFQCFHTAPIYSVEYSGHSCSTACSSLSWGFALPSRRRLPGKVSRPPPPSSQNLPQLRSECGWLAGIASVVTSEVPHPCPEPLAHPSSPPLTHLSPPRLPTRPHHTSPL